MNRRSSHGMFEGNLVRMQADSAVFVGAREAVLQVSLDVYPAGRKLSPDLVMSSRQEIDVIEDIAFRLSDLSVLEAGLLKVCWLHPAHRRLSTVRHGAVCKALVLHRIPVDEVPELTVIGRQLLVGNGPVVLFDLAGAEHFRDQ